MHEHILADAARLSDDALFARIEVLANRERDATVELVAHLAVLDARRSHLGEGAGSLYLYCRDQLHLSEDAAWNRAATASAVRRYPIILDWLMDGSLNVTTVRVLRPVLTAENHVAVLTEARRRTRKEVEVLAARINPKPDVPSTVRKVAPAVEPPSPTLPLGDASAPYCAPAPAPTPAQTQPPPSSRPIVAPLAPERYRVQFTVSKDTHDKLRHIQDLLCREITDGDPAAIFDRALDALQSEIEKKKLAATTRPRSPRGTKDGTRHIPANVRRAVWKRDGGRCAFEGRSGRCSERRFLEWHHVQPHGHQGAPTISNISLRCRAHNVYESELVFGPFDPSVVREAGENYAVSGRITPVPERERMEATGAVRNSSGSATLRAATRPGGDRAMGVEVAQWG